MASAVTNVGATSITLWSRHGGNGGTSLPSTAFYGTRLKRLTSKQFIPQAHSSSGKLKIDAEVDEQKQTGKDKWKGLVYDVSDDQQDIARGKGMVDSLFQAPMGTGTHNAIMNSYDYISTGLRQYDMDNNMDGFYIAPAFMSKLVIHITKNFMALPNIKVPLILGIWGGKGQGKSFQCELVFAKMGINPIMMSAGELESGNAGEPAKLIRQRYREAADRISKGKMCVLFINDLDAGAGRLGGTTQYTVNNQMVNATLMNIADNPTNVQLPGMYNKQENPRVPIIVTGNDFSTLYAPLIRDGRMEKFYWAPTREDRIGVCQGIFRADNIPKEDIVKLVDAFPGQSIDFFGAIRARVYDDEVRGWITSVGVENIGKSLVNSREGPPTFEKPPMTIEKLLEYGKMLVQEQENVKRVQLADKYLNEAALGDANKDAIDNGSFYGKAAQEIMIPVPEGCADPNAKNYDPTARSDDGSCSYESETEPSGPLPTNTEEDAPNPTPYAVGSSPTIEREEDASETSKEEDAQEEDATNSALSTDTQEEDATKSALVETPLPTTEEEGDASKTSGQEEDATESALSVVKPLPTTEQEGDASKTTTDKEVDASKSDISDIGQSPTTTEQQKDGSKLAKGRSLLAILLLLLRNLLNGLVRLISGSKES